MLLSFQDILSTLWEGVIRIRFLRKGEPVDYSRDTVLSGYIIRFKFPLWMIFLDSDQLSIQLLSVIKYGFLSVNNPALI